MSVIMSADVAIHGNDRHSPRMYPLDGSERLTNYLNMYLMPPGEEPLAVSENEGRHYYIVPHAGSNGILKTIMCNTTGAFESVQLGLST